MPERAGSTTKGDTHATPSSEAPAGGISRAPHGFIGVPAIAIPAVPALDVIARAPAPGARAGLATVAAGTISRAIRCNATASEREIA